MLDLILIIMLIVSFFKPDVLLAKIVKEKATDDEKTTVTKNLRKIYAVVVGLLESLGIMMNYNESVGLILAVIFLVLFFIFSIPAVKENKQILKELKERE